MFAWLMPPRRRAVLISQTCRILLSLVCWAVFSWVPRSSSCEIAPTLRFSSRRRLLPFRMCRNSASFPQQSGSIHCTPIAAGTSRAMNVELITLDPKPSAVSEAFRSTLVSILFTAKNEEEPAKSSSWPVQAHPKVNLPSPVTLFSDCDFRGRQACTAH